MNTYLEYTHHPIIGKLVNILKVKTQNPDTSMATIMVCYQLAKLASMMRCEVDAKGYGKFPVNFYGISCAPSGAGKGHSMAILENQVMKPFMDSFLEVTRPTVITKQLMDLANKRALRGGTDPQEELEKVEGEFRKLGAYVSSFDSGTAPAVKQFRHQLLMTEVGSINFEVDEIGNNLINSKEITDIYLELWDGAVKSKLIKNTADNVRNEEIFGKTPTNMIGFGTPDAVYDGGATEKMMQQMLITGYARRCFFGYSDITFSSELTLDQRLDQLMDTTSDTDLYSISQQLEKLADPLMHKFTVEIPADVLKEVLAYQMECERRTALLRKSDGIRRAELRGRHFKTIKFAGALAFLDIASVMTSAHWRAAVRIAEESGIAFSKMVSQDPPHARLAKFLADYKEPATMADLLQELPFFPKASNQQKDLINLAIAWGHKDGIIIKKKITDDILTLQGEALEKTDLTKLIVSHSNHIAYDYCNGIGEWKEFKDLVLMKGTIDGLYHWCNHHFIDGHRTLANTVQGFNTIVLDIDGTCRLELAQEILKKFEYLIYTTKRHSESEHRYRVILPMSHTLKLSIEEYKEFMDNILEFLPFEVDTGVKESNKKWLTNPTGTVYENHGELFDVISFIPRTRKNDVRKQQIIDMGNMDGLERFFYQEAQEGNRNNTISRYGFALVDAGYDANGIREKIIAFNAKLSNPLPEDELEDTVINSSIKKYLTKG